MSNADEPPSCSEFNSLKTFKPAGRGFWADVPDEWNTTKEIKALQKASVDFLYANARGGTTTPALNALASILVVTTLIGVGNDGMLGGGMVNVKLEVAPAVVAVEFFARICQVCEPVARFVRL